MSDEKDTRSVGDDSCPVGALCTDIITLVFDAIGREVVERNPQAVKDVLDTCSHSIAVGYWMSIIEEMDEGEAFGVILTIPDHEVQQEVLNEYDKFFEEKQ